MANTTTTQARPASSKLLRMIAIVIIALIVVVGLVVLITWLIVKPKQLVFSIENRSAKNFNLRYNHLNATFDFGIRARNPNHKVSVYYDSLDVSVAYDSQTIAFNTLDPFHQPRHNVTQLKAHIEARDVALSKSLIRELRLEKASGEIELEVRIRARIRYKVGVWKSRHRTLRVLCPSVIARFSSNSYQISDCDLDF